MRQVLARVVRRFSGYSREAARPENTLCRYFLFPGTSALIRAVQLDAETVAGVAAVCFAGAAGAAGRVASGFVDEPTEFVAGFALLCGPDVFASPAPVSPGGRGGLASAAAESAHCTISETRRLDGSSGLDGMRSIWSAYPRTCEI